MLFVYILLNLSMYRVYAKMGCKDMNGKHVDWFVAIKLPSEVDAQYKGKSFVYFDPKQKEWQLSRRPINDTKSAIGATLRQFYGFDKKTILAIAYNDDRPDGGADGYRAHSKGAMVFDKKSGFWLVHSVPNFPPTGHYDYPSSGTKYGQSFLCLSLSVNALEDLGQYMRYAHAATYYDNLPDYFKLAAPYLVDVANKKSLSKSARNYTTVRKISTLGGQKATAFSKNRKFGADLWYDFIGLYLNTSMSVETWRIGSGANIGSSCAVSNQKPQVTDITSVRLLGKEYSYRNDHSKWGVSREAKRPVVCIGDINRQVSQYKRGGGAVCIENIRLWMAFSKSIGTYNSCRVNGN